MNYNMKDNFWNRVKFRALWHITLCSELKYWRWIKTHRSVWFFWGRRVASCTTQVSINHLKWLTGVCVLFCGSEKPRDILIWAQLWARYCLTEPAWKGSSMKRQRLKFISTNLKHLVFTFSLSMQSTAHCKIQERNGAHTQLILKCIKKLFPTCCSLLICWLVPTESCPVSETSPKTLCFLMTSPPPWPPERSKVD